MGENEEVDRLEAFEDAISQARDYLNDSADHDGSLREVDRLEAVKMLESVLDIQ